MDEPRIIKSLEATKRDEAEIRDCFFKPGVKRSGAENEEVKFADQLLTFWPIKQIVPASDDTSQ